MCVGLDNAKNEGHAKLQDPNWNWLSRCVWFMDCERMAGKLRLGMTTWWNLHSLGIVWLVYRRWGPRNDNCPLQNITIYMLKRVFINKINDARWVFIQHWGLLRTLQDPMLTYFLWRRWEQNLVEIVIGYQNIHAWKWIWFVKICMAMSKRHSLVQVLMHKQCKTCNIWPACNI